MSRYRQVILLARREFVQRAKSRTFLVAMGILVAAVVLAGPIILLLQGEEEPMPGRFRTGGARERPA